MSNKGITPPRNVDRALAIEEIAHYCGSTRRTTDSNSVSDEIVIRHRRIQFGPRKLSAVDFDDIPTPACVRAG